MQREILANKAVYFVRINPKGVGEKGFENDIAVGQVPTDALEAFRTLLAELYLPVLTQQGTWGRSTKKQTQAFLQVSIPLSQKLALINLSKH